MFCEQVRRFARGMFVNSVEKSKCGTQKCALLFTSASSSESPSESSPALARLGL
jgi:hypothetical protein